MLLFGHAGWVLTCARNPVVMPDYDDDSPLQVPTLVHNGVVLIESNDILVYLAQQVRRASRLPCGSLYSVGVRLAWGWHIPGCSGHLGQTGTGLVDAQHTQRPSSTMQNCLRLGAGRLAKLLTPPIALLCGATPPIVLLCVATPLIALLCVAPCSRTCHVKDVL